MARLTPRSSAARTFCPPKVSSANMRLLRLVHDSAALGAGAMREAAEEAIEYGRELGFDVGDLDEFFVELGAAVFAVPLEAVELARPARTLDDQAHGVGRATRRVRHVRRQQENLAFADRHVHSFAVLDG